MKIVEIVKQDPINAYWVRVDSLCPNPQAGPANLMGAKGMRPAKILSVSERGRPELIVTVPLEVDPPSVGDVLLPVVTRRIASEPEIRIRDSAAVRGIVARWRMLLSKDTPEARQERASLVTALGWFVMQSVLDAVEHEEIKTRIAADLLLPEGYVAVWEKKRCTHCRLTPEDAQGGACESLSGPEHDFQPE